MPRPRCLWCTEPPFEDTAVLKWRGEERERLTVPLCRKHLSRLKEAGTKGKETKGWFYKVGWWQVPERGEGNTRWTAGETIALRYITRDNLPGMAWPATVVRDTYEMTAIFIPAGATYKRWRIPPAAATPGGPVRQLEDAPWRRDTLRLMYPGAQHSIWLSWTGQGAERTLHSYYINMEEPFRRSTVGLDTNDHTLDVVVHPDLSWEWKDAEEFATRTERGVFGEEFARSVRAEGEAAIARLEARLSPFCDSWEIWTPDPSWAIPELPGGWDTVPATLWDRRVWAYGEMAR